MFEHLRASGLIPSNMVAHAAAGAQSRSEKPCVMGVVTDEVEGGGLSGFRSVWEMPTEARMQRA